jgi:hypothetical protein
VFFLLAGQDSVVFFSRVSIEQLRGFVLSAVFLGLFCCRSQFWFAPTDFPFSDFLPAHGLPLCLARIRFSAGLLGRARLALFPDSVLEAAAGS